jgi:hypothetical protein
MATEQHASGSISEEEPQKQLDSNTMTYRFATKGNKALPVHTSLTCVTSNAPIRKNVAAQIALT